MSEPPSLVT